MNMKIIITIIVIFCMGSLGIISTQAQTIIGIKASNYPGNSSVLLEFSNQNKGFVVPWIPSPTLTAPAAGTLYFDASSNYMLKLYNGSSYINLTQGAAKNTLTTTTVAVPNGTDDTTKKTVIGAKTSAIPGAVVLESTTKIMVLPKVTSPHLNIVNPAAGMIVYDPTNKALCTFNGQQWTFWSYK